MTSCSASASSTPKVFCVYGTNTDLEEYEADSLSGRHRSVVEIDALDLVEGT